MFVVPRIILRVCDSKEISKTQDIVLPADFACEESDFDKEGVIFHLAKEIEVSLGSAKPGD